MAEPDKWWTQYPDVALPPAPAQSPDQGNHGTTASKSWWDQYPDAHGNRSPSVQSGSVAHPAGSSSPNGSPSAPASWTDRALMALRKTDADLTDRMRVDSGGHYGTKPVVPAPLPTQQEADAAKLARGDQSLVQGYIRQAGQGMLGIGDEAEAYARHLAGEDYDAALADIRAKNKSFAHAEPGVTATARLAGTAPLAALPVGRVLDGASSLANMALRSEAVGSALSAAHGFGDGEDGFANRVASAGKAVGHFLTDPVAQALAVGVPSAAYGISALGNAAGAGASGTIPNLVRRNAAVDAERTAEKIATVDAADRLDVRLNPTMAMDAPGNTVHRVGTNIPVVGKPALDAVADTYDTVREAGEGIVRGLTTADTVPQAGRSLQAGLDTYRSAGIQHVDPAQLTAIGINPFRPAPPPIPMSRDAMTNARQAEAIRTQEGLPPPEQLSRPADFRRSAEDLSDAEIMRVINARDMPFAARQEALYERWWRSMQDMMRANGTANLWVAAVNTREAMQQIEAQIVNQISGQGRLTGDLADRLLNHSSRFSIGDLRAIRTEIGRALANFGVMDQRLDRTQLNQIYASLSRDIELGVQDMANQALIRSRLPVGAPDRVDPEVAEQAQASLRYLRRADRFTRAGMARMESFAKVLGAKTPEQGMQRLISAATEGSRGNAQLVHSAMQSLSAEQRNDVAGVMLREMWRPRPSASGYVAETGYSPASFITNWERMSPQARQAIFGGREGLPQAIDDFVRVSRSLKEFEATVNYSNSGSHLITALIGGELLHSIAGFTKTVGLGAMGYGGMYLWNSPQAVRLMTAYLRARLSVAQRIANGTPPGRAGNALTSFARTLQTAAQVPTPYAPIAAAVSADLATVRRMLGDDGGTSRQQ